LKPVDLACEQLQGWPPRSRRMQVLPPSPAQARRARQLAARGPSVGLGLMGSCARPSSAAAPTAAGFRCPRLCKRLPDPWRGEAKEVPGELLQAALPAPILLQVAGRGGLGDSQRRAGCTLCSA